MFHACVEPNLIWPSSYCLLNSRFFFHRSVKLLTIVFDFLENLISWREREFIFRFHCKAGMELFNDRDCRRVI